MINFKYKVLGDSNEVYAENSIISGSDLIDDYVEMCNETEDADTIGWLLTCKDKDMQTAIDFIADLWGMDLEKIV